MPAGSESLQGPRLEFVVKKLPGTVTTTKYKGPPTKRAVDANPSLAADLSNKAIEVEEDAGYMVYLPTGSCYRMSGAELVARGYDRQPNILSYEQANNVETPAGRFKLARNDAERQKAMKDMEDQIIKACQGRFGSASALVSNYNPHGKVSEAA